MVSFPQNSCRARYNEKYHCISSTIENVCHVHFSSKAFSNYLYCANKNLTKDLGKVKGLLRWSFYQKETDKIVENSRPTLKALVSSREPSRTDVDKLREQLRKLESDNENMSSYNTDGTSYLEKIIDSVDTNDFPNWKISSNCEDGTSHLYYVSEISRGYCQVEVIINNNGFWRVLHEGRDRCGVTLDRANISNKIYLLTFKTVKICNGISIENYETVLPKDNTVPVYNTRSGEAAAFIENNPSKFHKKIHQVNELPSISAIQ